MGCFNNSNSVCNNCNSESSDVCGGGFNCIINLIVILIILQFLTQILCGCNGDDCC